MKQTHFERKPSSIMSPRSNSLMGCSSSHYSVDTSYPLANGLTNGLTNRLSIQTEAYHLAIDSSEAV